MQSVLLRIWTRVAASISYDDNDYTTDTLNLINKTTSGFNAGSLYSKKEKKCEPKLTSCHVYVFNI